MKKLILILYILFLLFYQNPFTTVTAQSNAQLDQLTLAKRHREVIELVEPHVLAGEELPVWPLCQLASAYYELRIYDNLRTTLNTIDRKMARGETTYYNMDITPMPYLLRAALHVDLAEYKQALQNAGKAYLSAKLNVSYSSLSRQCPANHLKAQL